ncbi:MAG: YciI family protein, partial [Acidobacteria bacterium]|nr:YciI family protein [Acidobacteriota bacterium]MBP8275153.1 YciI family protein [Acidobacteriota bacterium]
GFMIAGDGLMPSTKGSRIVRARGGRITVLDGPFAEAKELVAGYWMVQAATIDEVIAWVKEYPYPVRDNCDVEIRPVIR